MLSPLARIIAVALLLLLLGTGATPALAYIGPGAGLGAFGTVFAIIGAFLLLIVGFVWYPVKRLLRGRKAKPDAAPGKTDAPENDH